MTPIAAETDERSRPVGDLPTADIASEKLLVAAAFAVRASRDFFTDVGLRMADDSLANRMRRQDGGRIHRPARTNRDQEIIAHRLEAALPSD